MDQETKESPNYDLDAQTLRFKIGKKQNSEQEISKTNRATSPEHKKSTVKQGFILKPT